LFSQSAAALELIRQEEIDYDKEKYREMLLDAAETVLGYFGFDRTIYGGDIGRKNRKWWHDLRGANKRHPDLENVKIIETIQRECDYEQSLPERI